MKNYDFNTQLTPEEFENLGCDIVEVRENIILERFKKNKDLGIDGRNISNEGTLIVQCKRVQNIDSLISKLKNEELEKVKRINPDRYILVLSSNPTIKQKAKICDLFSNFIHSSSDIITAEDINGYLRKTEYFTINKYYSELILSKNIDLSYFLENIKNPILKNKSDSLMDDIKNIKNYFIETKIYNSAYDSLLKNRIIFLSGDAGSGKTTNAKMQLNRLLEENYVDFIYQIDSCEELSALLLSKQKIGILYDDFWGSTFSDLKLPLNSEKKLQDLLYKIGAMDNIYFILTTREYVLNQGLAFYKDFYNKSLDKRIIHKNCKYTNKEKINILFAHAKNSNLDFDCLYKITCYANEIINSRNYSPRSISYFINKYQDTNLSSDEFIDTFLEYLDNPTDFLKSIFYKLSEGAQILAYVLSISNPEVFVPYLKKSFQSVAKRIDGVKPSLFEEYMKELLDFFITNYGNDSKLVDFTDHSIFDFINEEFSIKIVDYEDAFCNGVIYFNQIYNLLINFDLSLDNQNVLINFLINNFDRLLIMRDDEIFLSAEEMNVEPWTYTSHKIWKTLKIAEKTNNCDLKNFLCKRIYILLDSYDNKIHHYEDKNFIDIPEIISVADKIGIKFSAKEVVKFYLNSFNYLFELHYVKYFPNEYKEILAIEMENLGKKLKKNIELRLLNELYTLSFEGITIEYEFTIDSLPEILKMLKITNSKTIKNIVNNCGYTPSGDLDLNDIYDLICKIKIPKSSTEKEIKKFEKQLFYEQKLSKNKFINVIKHSSLNENSKKRLLKSIKEENGIWSFLVDSTVDFAYFILSFYEEEERQNHPFITTRKVFMSLLEYINNGEIINFLKQYAYDTTYNSYNPLSNNHICKKYCVSESLIKYLINLGVIYRNNNIIDFSNRNFEIFLSTMYMKDNKNSKDDYMKYFLREGIFHAEELSFMEEFNAYHFNHVLLLPILDLILKQGINEFKKNILNINLEEDGMSISYSNELNLINLFIESLFRTSISSDICQLFDDNSKSSFKIINFYNQNIDTLKNKQIDELCDKYFYLLNDLYVFLKKLKVDDNFSIFIDDNDNYVFQVNM